MRTFPNSSQVDLLPFQPEGLYSFSTGFQPRAVRDSAQDKNENSLLDRTILAAYRRRRGLKLAVDSCLAKARV